MPCIKHPALAQRLQPAADTRFVVTVDIAEAPLKIRLFPRDHAVTHSKQSAPAAVSSRALLGGIPVMHPCPAKQSDCQERISEER